MSMNVIVTAGLMTAASLLASCAAVSAQTSEACAMRTAPAAYAMSEVTDNGLVAAFYDPDPDPDGVERRPALLILGGSEGGSEGVRMLAKPFAEQGYAVLALSYHGVEGLPRTYADIPLEYFDKAIDWLAANPAVDPERIGVYGISKGGELSLLLGSRSKKLHAVAAGAPSSVVWQGGADARYMHSTWTVDGKDAPFLPYDMSKPFDVRDYMGSIHRMYDGALTNAAAHADAVIPVERINGPILMISGKADAMWPSSRMSDDVVKRLQDKGFAHPVTNLAYPDAGHAVGMPPAFGASKKGPDEAAGGTAEGNAVGRADMWPKLVCFFDKALKF